MTVGDRRSVLIVDDHAAFRAFAGLLLEADGWDVVGQAADGAEAITATAALAPGVVLLDIQLPDRNGIDVARQLARIPAAPCVVLMSVRAASEYGEGLRTAAVCGFLAKHELSGSALSGLVGGTGQPDRR